MHGGSDGVQVFEPPAYHTVAARLRGGLGTRSESAGTTGVLGAGRVGTAIARQALQAGYEVLVATSRPASEIELMVEDRVRRGAAPSLLDPR